jgi:hypothetical protein
MINLRGVAERTSSPELHTQAANGVTPMDEQPPPDLLGVFEGASTAIIHSLLTSNGTRAAWYRHAEFWIT